MTLMEFIGCSMVAYSVPLALFIYTIATDPIRIIILVAASFFWLMSLLISALLWYIVVPLREILAFGVVFSVLFQEAFRYIVYRILRRTEQGLQALAEDTRITENKHILAYVSGLGFGITSSILSFVNVLADMSGPGTLGLKGGSEMFFLTSAAQALSICLLHSFWSVIFFHALDVGNYFQISYVLSTHLTISLLTLLNTQGLYVISLNINYIITIITAVLAFRVAGGTNHSFKRFITCR